MLFNPSPVSHITGISMTFLFPASFGCSVTIQETWNPEEAFGTVVRDRTTFMMFATPFLQALSEIAEDRDVRLDTSARSSAAGPTSPSRCPAVPSSGWARWSGCTAPRSVPTPAAGPRGICRPRSGAPRAGGSSPPRLAWSIPTPGSTWAWVRWGRPAASPQMCSGYVDGSLNASSYTADGYFRTGDLVSVDAEGYVTVRGRLKEIINRGGEKFSSREIEEMIRSLAVAAEVAVTPMSDAVLGEKVCAWVVLREGHDLTLSQLCEHLLGFGLAKQKLPERPELIDELPRTPSGKIRKVDLRHRIDRVLNAASVNP